MNKRFRRALPSSSYRVLLSDVLPYELPPSFSNLGLFKFLNSIGLVRDESGVYWGRRLTRENRAILSIVFGEEVKVDVASVDHGGRHRLVIAPSKRYAQTVPFKFSIRHKQGSRRQLAVAHPRSQLDVVDFYSRFGPLVLHHSARSRFSLRRPKSIARVGIYRDWLFAVSVGGYADRREVEKHGRSDVVVRSYFTYDRFTNIHQFYESSEYRSLERKYGYLIKADITKCFDSIYTHSVAWATSGRDLVKDNLRAGRDAESIGAVFDSLLQSQNHDETSGILIGSEYARVFAELVLQRVDHNVERRLRQHGLIPGRDYEVLRYVDDYFIFLANRDRERLVVDVLEEELRAFKLHLNAAKGESAETPWLSPLSVAKERLRLLIDVPEHAEPHRDGRPWAISAARMVAEYKRVLIDTEADPADLANFALTRVERAVDRLVGAASYFENGAENVREEPVWERQRLVDRAIGELVELAFFVYAGSRRASPGVKLGRIVTTVQAFYSLSDVAIDRREAAHGTLVRELVLQLRRFGQGDRGGVEQMLLVECLTSLGSIGSLDGEELLRVTGIESEGVSLLNAVPLLRHIADRPGYDETRRLVADWIATLPVSATKDGTVALAALSLFNCPYISAKSRADLLRVGSAMPSESIVDDLASSGAGLVDWWSFDLYTTLQSKRIYDVY